MAQKLLMVHFKASITLKLDPSEIRKVLSLSGSQSVFPGTADNWIRQVNQFPNCAISGPQFRNPTPDLHVNDTGIVLTSAPALSFQVFESSGADILTYINRMQQTPSWQVYSHSLKLGNVSVLYPMVMPIDTLTLGHKYCPHTV